ncbi:VOC family protein [Olsenella uli]|uniref:VOC family protein n=1 Tax=Olsenella uli TaxID=133926 RepID=UPI0019589031|nr:VOC family protein [Olsenella uli]MBM6817057.1 VOC family protein [Olsenella uli]
MPASENPVELFGLRLAHVGINTTSPDEAAATADALCALLGIERGAEPFPVSSFAGTLVEVMNNGGRGARGHIGLHVDDIDAAQAWYEARGVEFNEASRALCPDGSGRTYLIYFKEEIAGFAIHLTIA